MPLAVLNKVPETRRKDLEKCRNHLADTIGKEGNSVWTWYATNIAAPYLLSERKVNPDYSSRKHKMSKRARHVESDQRVTGYPQKTAETRPG